MPRESTLDWVGRLGTSESDRGTVALINAEPRSLSARSAHPPKSRAASPALLARRNVGLDGVVSPSLPWKTHGMAHRKGGQRD